MNTFEAKDKTYLVTGATSGLGLATCKKVIEFGAKRVIFAARNRSKAEKIIERIRADTSTGNGKTTATLEILDLDTSTAEAGKIAAEKVVGPIDGVVLNAGGLPGADMQRDANGIESCVAMNLSGNLALLEGLLAGKKLNKGAHVVYVSSEIARGVNNPIMQQPFPKLDTEDEAGVVDILTGAYWEKENRKYVGMDQYAFTKQLGTLYMSALARTVDPKDELVIVSVSPGATRGTNVMDEMDMNCIEKFLFKHVMLYLFFHSIEEGLNRYLAGLNLGYNNDKFPLKSGHFYASPSGKVTGKYQDQFPLFPVFESKKMQDLALKTIRKQFDL